MKREPDWHPNRRRLISLVQVGSFGLPEVLQLILVAAPFKKAATAAFVMNYLMVRIPGYERLTIRALLLENKMVE